MSEGFMTPESAERAIWSYYWQLDNHQDRRGAPLVMEPPDRIDAEEAARLRDAQTPLWRKVQVKAWETAKKKASGSSAAAGAARAILGWGKSLGRTLTTPAQREYMASLIKDAQQEVDVEEQAKHQNSIDPDTGLPIHKADLNTGRGVVVGIDLCMEAIVPPEDLALAATTWLPPCPEDENEATWGQELDHWQALMYKPKEKQCDACGGKGATVKKVAQATSTTRNIIVRDDAKFANVRCDTCGGRGSYSYWDDDEVMAIKHNARMIGEVVGDLAHEGYFDERPISDNDVEMGDLVWKTKGGLTLGFRLTPDGYDRMKQYCEQDDELQEVLHVLALAGKHIREAAPEWAQAEYNQGKAIEVESSGGFKVDTSGGGFSS